MYTKSTFNGLPHGNVQKLIQQNTLFSLRAEKYIRSRLTVLDKKKKSYNALFILCKQNGRLVGAAVEGDLSPSSGVGEAAAASAGGQKPAPFNLSHLEYTLPDTEIYEPETGNEDTNQIW